MDYTVSSTSSVLNVYSAYTCIPAEPGCVWQCLTGWRWWGRGTMETWEEKEPLWDWAWWYEWWWGRLYMQLSLSKPKLQEAQSIWNCLVTACFPNRGNTKGTAQQIYGTICVLYMCVCNSKCKACAVNIFTSRCTILWGLFVAMRATAAVLLLWRLSFMILLHTMPSPLPTQSIMRWLLWRAGD